MKYILFLSFFLIFCSIKSQVSIDWLDPMEMANMEKVKTYLGTIDKNYCWIRSKGKDYNLDFINPTTKEIQSVNFELKVDDDKLTYLGGSIFNGKIILFSAKKGKKKAKTTLFFAQLDSKNSSVNWTELTQTSSETYDKSNISLKNNHLTLQFGKSFFIFNNQFELTNSADLTKYWNRGKFYSDQLVYVNSCSNSYGELYILSHAGSAPQNSNSMWFYEQKNIQYVIHKINKDTIIESDFPLNQSKFITAKIDVNEIDQVCLTGYSINLETKLPQITFSNIEKTNLSFNTFHSKNIEIGDLVLDTKQYKALCKDQKVADGLKENELSILKYRIKEYHSFNGEQSIVMEGYVEIRTEGSSVRNFYMNVIVVRIDKNGEITDIVRIPKKNFQSMSQDVSSILTIWKEGSLYFLYNYYNPQDKKANISYTKLWNTVKLTILAPDNLYVSKDLYTGNKIIDLDNMPIINDKMYVLKSKLLLLQIGFGDSKERYCFGELNI
jgi:hypothetical protein